MLIIGLGAAWYLFQENKTNYVPLYTGAPLDQVPITPDDDEPWWHLEQYDDFSNYLRGLFE
jgi:hypothetical protein